MWEACKKAVFLLLSLDPQTYQVIFLSLLVSLTATFLASLVGIPFGLFLGAREFRGKAIVVRILYMFMSVPPVIMGLFVFLFLSRKGPFGALQLIYTPTAMIIAQMLLVLPIVAGQVYGASRDKSQLILQAGKTFGAGKRQQFFLLCHELSPALFMAFAVGYGRAISEVGAVMLVGGNIAGHTRVMTTSISTLQSMGKYDAAIAFGIVLLLISFLIQSLIYSCQNEPTKKRRGKK